MSKDHNTIQCGHGKGLACRICYDQTFGADFHLRATRAKNASRGRTRSAPSIRTAPEGIASDCI